jgi:acetyl-CoA acetyltransferase
MTKLARAVAIAGAGSSRIARDGDDPVAQLAVDACKAALDDAGLTGKDVDGVFEYSFGWDSPDAHYMQRALGIPDLAAYADIGPMGPSGLGGAVAAIAAVASGGCETALVYRAITQSAGNTGSFAGTGRPSGAMGDTIQFTLPYGYFPIIPGIAMMMRRRMDEFGAKIEDFGTIAINARRWAAMNERAVLRDPISMDEYLASRVLAEPLHLLDCDYPVSGASAVVVTTGERARDLAKRPVAVDAMAQASGPRPDWVQAEDFMFGATRRCAERLWSRASVTANDVDVALLYDGFTHITISWIEALGFCGIGEAGGWLDGGRRIGPGGALPLNTHGGQLAEGRLHGLRHLVEAVFQLRGECGERQVDGAKVAVVTNGHGPQCGALVLTSN